MIFATHKESFLVALDRLSRIVKSSPKSIDVLQCVKIESYGTEVFAVATSSMASARVLIKDAVVGEPGSFLVNLDRLKDRVSKAAPQIKLQADSGTLKIISSDDQKLGLALNDEREFPEVKWVMAEESYGLDKQEVITLFKKAHALTNNANVLTPSFLQVRIVDQTLWVANGVSYQQFPIQCNPALESSIPTQTLFAITGFAQESEGDTVWLSQAGEDEVVVTVGKAVEFPNLAPVFDKVRISTANSLRVSRRKLVDELSKAKSSTDEYGRVTIDIQRSAMTSITVQAQASNGDWYESRLTGAWDGESERSLTFNLDSLHKFLQTFSDDEVTINIGDDFKGELSPAYIEEEGHIGIINQFRI